MANSNNTRLAALVGVLVGVLMGAGAVRTAELTADMLIARTDFHYRSQRYNTTQSDEGFNSGNGLTGARRLEWRTDDTRTEKAPAFHGSAFETIKGRCPVENTQCFVNEINAFLREQADR